MKRIIAKLTLTALLAMPLLSLTGCNAGDENPISPEDMEARRKQDGQARGNFNPSDAPPKPQ